MITNSDKKLPKSKWMSRKLWKETLKYLPIACIDIIFERRDSQEILMGYRIIPPYKNVWALIGGRMIFGEGLREAAARIAKEYGIKFQRLYLVGVFPVVFSFRSDVAIALASPDALGDPIADKKEFSTFKWTEEPPNRTGGNYVSMIASWKKVKQSGELLELNRIG